MLIAAAVLSLVGTIPTVIVGPSTAALRLTGASWSTTASTSFEADALALTGVAPTVQIGVAGAMTPAAGTLALTGSTFSTMAATGLGASAMTLTGPAPAVSVGSGGVTMAPSAGA